MYTEGTNDCSHYENGVLFFMKRFLAVALLAALCIGFSACSGDGEGTSDSPKGSEQTSVSVTVPEVFATEGDEMFSNRDGETEADGGVTLITLKGDGATCEGSGAVCDGARVTVQAAGTYRVTGTLNGSLTVEAGDEDKIHLILDGAAVTCADGAALCVLSADKVFVTLAEGTENALNNGGTFAESEENVDGAVFSRQDLTWNGDGALTVSSTGGHGIVCKDDLVFSGGKISVTAASHGVDANDSIRIRSTALTVKAGKDGLHCENTDDAERGFVYMESGTLDVQAEGDGISASAHGQFEGGTVNILAGGGAENGASHGSGGYGGFPGSGGPGGKPSHSKSTTTETASTDDSTSMKGIKAEHLLFTDGTYDVDSADDSIHANGTITVNGGVFTLATGDDGAHADDSLSVTGGTVTVTESYEGLEATNLVLSGGKITVTADDDGLNAAGGTDSSGLGGRDNGQFGGPGGMSAGNGSIVISGGTLHITASGDGIDANGTLTITGGHVTVQGPTQGDTSTLDFDRSAVLSGGTFIGTGASGMAQTFSDVRNQGVIAIRTGSQAAGTEISVKDSDGKVILTHTPSLSFAILIVSTPDLVKGESYEICIGNQSAEFEAE